MVILNHLALFVPRILGQSTAAAKGNPLHKQIESLAVIGRGLNSPAQLDAGISSSRKIVLTTELLEIGRKAPPLSFARSFLFQYIENQLPLRFAPPGNSSFFDAGHLVWKNLPNSLSAVRHVAEAFVNRIPQIHSEQGQINIFNLNRSNLIGNTGTNAKVTPNGPTTLSFASDQSWTDNTTGERRTRTEWQSLVVWNDLGKWAATLQKGTPLFVEGELVYEQYPRKVQAVVGKKIIGVKVSTKVAKIKVQRLIRLEPAANPEAEDLAGDAQ